MKKVYAYVIATAMVASSAILSEGCTKTTSSDDDLIGNWKKIDDFEGLARSEAVSFTIGNYGYVCTGASGSERFNDLWEYDISGGYWTDKADLPGDARNSAVGFSIGTKGYVGTGYNGTTRLKDFWEYDQASNTWIKKADFGGSPRFDAIGFSLNGKGYIGCGDDGNYLRDFWEYTPGTSAADPGTWEQKHSVGGSKRSAAMAFVANGNGYVMGGNNNGEIQQDLWMYDQSSGDWTEKAKVYNYSSDETFDDDYGTIPRQNGSVFNIGSYVYLATGETSSGSLNSTTWQYDPATDRWTQKTAFEGTSRTGAVALSIGNRGLVLTGRSGSLIMDNAYELYPNDEQVDND
jgi:N-acetylneuraminic acid mutarotase